LYVEQREGDIVRKQQLKSLWTGAGRKHFYIVTPQQCRKCKKIFLEIIDEQTLHGLPHGTHPMARIDWD
jgi:hypothetical protein